MADTTKIEWTATHLPDGTVLPGYTFNPWTGCTKVSPGCDHCYAEGWSKRSGHVEWGQRADSSRTSAANWAKPIKWNAEAEASGIRRKVFCASQADVFDNHGSITSGWHGDLWHLIARTPHLDWLLLTKRPQNIAKMLPESYGAPAWGNGWPNVWLGTTCENQAEADRRIPHLLDVPAAVHFISNEPGLSALDLTRIRSPESWGPNPEGWTFDALETGDHYTLFGDGPSLPSDGPYRDHAINWVICGGESGPGARPMHPDWARSLRDQCTAAGVPFFFKQWGEWAPDTGPLPGRDITKNGSDPIMEGKAACAIWTGTDWKYHRSGYEAPTIDTSEWVYRLGKKRAGRQLDGREWNQMPGVV